MKIAVGADHAGYRLKDHLLEQLSRLGHTYDDFGTGSGASVDYPDFAGQVAGAVARGDADLGLLVCGTGTGMAIAANKIGGIRAAACSDAYTARMARAHNDANVLAVGERIIGSGVAEEVLSVFLDTAFEGDRHAHRVEKIGALES